jgi:hypothetical protein
VRLAGCIVALIALVTLLPLRAGASSSDPGCTGSYGGGAPKPGPPLRFGIDPGPAGSAGGAQLPSAPDDPARDIAAVRALAAPGHVLVVRLNRVFWSDGQPGIDAFREMVDRYAKPGFEIELQVRYHPPAGEAGDMQAWTRTSGTSSTRLAPTRA